MSRIVGQCFEGIGIDLNEHGLAVRPELLSQNGWGRYPDEFLSDISGPFSVACGDGRLYFGIQPMFPWESEAKDIPDTPLGTAEMIARALEGKLIYDGEDEVVPYEELLALMVRDGKVNVIDDSWVELE